MSALDSFEFNLWAMPGESPRTVRVFFYKTNTGKEMLRFVERDHQRYLREIEIPVEQILSAKVTL